PLSAASWPIAPTLQPWPRAADFSPRTVLPPTLLVDIRRQHQRLPDLVGQESDGTRVATARQHGGVEQLGDTALDTQLVHHVAAAQVDDLDRTAGADTALGQAVVEHQTGETAVLALLRNAGHRVVA